MDDLKALAKEFVERGWIVALIGGAAMAARLMSSSVKLSFCEQLKRVFSAAISSSILWCILEHADVTSLYKAIAYGVVGVVTPELIEGIVKLGKLFQKNPEKFIKK